MAAMGWWTGLLCGLVLASVAPASAADGEAVEALSATLDVERTLLDEDLQRQASLSRRRGEAASRLASAQQSLDGVLARREVTRAGLDLLLAELEQAESERASLLVSERVVLDRIRERLRRIELLEHELDDLRGRQEKPVTGALNGTWDLALLPLEQRGSCVLQQNGTLVSGTYQLEGGWNGSLQGTLVNRKVFLVRIDSKLGKSMELEGYLSSDGKVIRGNWLNYELAGQEGGTGHWSATRRAAAKP